MATNNQQCHTPTATPALAPGGGTYELDDVIAAAYPDDPAETAKALADTRRARARERARANRAARKLARLQDQLAKLPELPATPAGAACGIDATAVPLAGDFHTTDVGNAERLVHRFGHGIRHCHPWKQWLYWDGARWSTDRTGVVAYLAKHTVRAILTEEIRHVVDADTRLALLQWALQSEALSRLTALTTLATSERHIPILPEQMDSDPWLLNCRNCTLDLRLDVPTLARPHAQADLITKIAPVRHDPAAQCPQWLATLNLVFAGCQELIDYWQMLCGMALTGNGDEQILPILYGTGSNGKSTIITTMLGLLGPDYAIKAPQNFLMARTHEVHPTELADLFGKRLVAAVETGENVRLNEIRVKELTGKDSIRARRMREDFWEFTPTHHLWLATNHRPMIRGMDHAIWRRLREIPFTVAIAENQAIKDMDARLAGEYSGILNWCIRGCHAWQQTGLTTPQAVLTATAEYRDQQDIFLQFCDATCIIASKATLATYATTPLSKVAIKAQAKPFYSTFNNWLSNNTSRGPMAPHEFSKLMQDHGYETRTDPKTRRDWYIGINLQHNTNSNPEQAEQ